MTLPLPTLRLLGDGRFHSGEQLGAQLGLSRSAVWKHLRGLERYGLRVKAIPGRGYRLEHPLELLDRDAILAGLGPRGQALLGGLELLTETASTNRYLIERAEELPSGHACLAEYQHAGRGRRGRRWIAPLGCSVCLSLLWRFPLEGPLVGGLGLALGVAVVHALRRLGARELGLKWPNDVLWRGRKLAGLLLEMSGEAYGACTVVVGVGLNVRFPSRQVPIDRPWTDLSRVLGRTASRNEAAAALLDELLQACARFEAEGLQPFLSEWEALDLLRDKPVRLHIGRERSLSGIARGVDPLGALLLEREGRITRHLAGETTVRAAG